MEWLNVGVGRCCLACSMACRATVEDGSAMSSMAYGFVSSGLMCSRSLAMERGTGVQPFASGPSAILSCFDVNRSLCRIIS
jgi:hypothetical protein